MSEEINQCPEFPFFGAKYPDAKCIDGYLHDMDKCDDQGNLYIMDECHPCPFCNKDEFMQIQSDDEQDLKEVEKWIESINQRYNIKP